MRLQKSPLGMDVLTAARQRISLVFDQFLHVHVAFSGGKDSSVLLDLTAEEARRRGRRFGLLFIDLEAQYKTTIEHVQERFDALMDVVDPYWIALPLHLRNASSQLQPYWICWEPGQTWVRSPPKGAITDPTTFPWFRAGMEFEEFVGEFGAWYGKGDLSCGLIGIRCAESLDRWRALTRPKSMYQQLRWTTERSPTQYSAYPIYDWRTEDIWTYNGRMGAPYNKIYDLMYQAGVSIHQARICQPYGDDQRRGLWLYHILEPETWPKIVGRVSGTNTGALYARTRGGVAGLGKVERPPGHTWQSYTMFLLSSMPTSEAEHYKDKIAVFIHWWKEHRGVDLVDEGDPKLEAARKVASWKRVCKVLLKNDRLCKGLSFTQQTSTLKAYLGYRKVMQQRRKQWGIFPPEGSP